QRQDEARKVMRNGVSRQRRLTKPHAPVRPLGRFAYAPPSPTGYPLMRIQAALVREQGVRFAVVVVKRSALNDHSSRDGLRARFARVFSGVPVVLMAQDHRGTPTYYGRTDIVRFLQGVPFEAL